MSFKIAQKSTAFISYPSRPNIAPWYSDASDNIYYPSGNVGINNYNPLTAVDVNGTININSRNIDASGNSYNISPYYRVNGSPIDNLFYPALNTSSFSTKAVSTWSLRSHAVNKRFRSCCWSPELGIFVAVSALGTSDRVLTSPDGINWTTRTSAADYFWRSVCWSRQRSIFVAVSSDGTGNRVMTSPNGITWTSQTTPADYQWTSVTWAEGLGLFVAVAQSGTGNRVMTSSDGITWSLQTTPADYNWRSICWAPEIRLLVAVSETGTGNRVMTSSDGITWTLRNTPEDLEYQSVCWSAELRLFVAVAGTGANGRVITSSDGISWTLRSSILSYWNSVVWSPQLRIFVAVAQSDTRLMYSSNGINWTGVVISNVPNYSSICWSPQLSIFVAVGERDSVTSTLIATSSLAGRIPTSNNIFDSSFNDISESGLWRFQSFGRGIPVLKTGSTAITINPGENWVDVSCSADVSCNLPTASIWPGRELTLKNTSTFRVDAPVLSRSTNLLIGNVLPNTRGSWSSLVSNGSNWLIENSNW